MSGRPAEAGGSLRAAALGSVVTLTDLLPPRVRYGYVHRLTRMLLARPLPALTAPEATSPDPTGSPGPVGSGRPAPVADTTCVLAADGLDVGGIGSVVESLADALRAEGVRPVVVCVGDGRRAARMRAGGHEVVVVTDPATAGEALRAAAPDVVQLHSAPVWLEQVAIASGRPLVPVLHNTEIHYTRARWTSFTTLLRHSARAVAVSETVRRFHVARVPDDLGHRITVIPNGAPLLAAYDERGRAAARQRLADVLGVGLEGETVFVSLARYDSQKNVAGTVAGFLRALDSGLTRARLVMAGDPSDWAELLRADAIRRTSAYADRVHLLGNSDAGTLLAAADAFVLNSFFEGWPVAATEAAAAGLPLLISDAGGARELVAMDPQRSVLVPNACGDAGAVSDARVRAARRRSRRQPNRDQLVAGFVAVAQAAEEARRSRDAVGDAPGQHAAPQDASVRMGALHARLLREVAGSPATGQPAHP